MRHRCLIGNDPAQLTQPSGGRVWMMSAMNAPALRRATLALAVLVFVAGCGGTGPNTGGLTWSSHVDPAGYSVDQPNSWTINRDGKTGMVTLHGPDGAQVVMLPFYTSQQLNSQNAGAALQQLGSTVMPQAQWQAPLTSSGTNDRMTGTSNGNPAMAVIAWKQSGNSGTAGYAYSYVAPRAQYSSDIDVATRIMSTFKVRGSATTAAPTYTTWTDPNEAAYSLQIPKGWSATGGLTRPSSLLTRFQTIAGSADQSEQFLIGNDFPFYTEPNAYFQAGSSYPLGDYSSPVEPYQPGAQAVGSVVPLPAGAQIVSTQNRSDIAAVMPSVGAGDHFDAGEVIYQFVKGGVTYRGDAICITEELTPGGGLVDWQVWQVNVAAAPAGRLGIAQSALEHAVATFKIDPTWAQQQSQTELKQSQIIAQAGQQISDTIMQTWNAQQSASDEIARREENSVLGTVDVVDPSSGDTFKLDDSPNYYWADNSGNIVGTNTSTSPGADFRSLITLP
jgi:hypothetical protein